MQFGNICAEISAVFTKLESSVAQTKLCLLECNWTKSILVNQNWKLLEISDSLFFHPQENNFYRVYNV